MTYATFKPRSIDHHATLELLCGIGLSASTYSHIKRTQKDLGYRFYVVEQTRGRCYRSIKRERRMITIPLWVWRQRNSKSQQPGYCNQYVCHEIAHAWTVGGHDDEFYAMLKTIAPAETMHYELDYKPRNAASAGVAFNLSELL